MRLRMQSRAATGAIASMNGAGNGDSAAFSDASPSPPPALGNILVSGRIVA